MRHVSILVILCLGVILIMSACECNIEADSEKKETCNGIDYIINEPANNMEGYDVFIPDLEHVAKLFDMKKNEILEWLGDDYEILEGAGNEGGTDGYMYSKYSITIIFDVYYDEYVDLIYGFEMVDVCGAKFGMTFAEIQEYLPESVIFDYNYIDNPDLFYALRYEFGDIRVVFDAGLDKDGETTELAFMRI